MLLAELTIRMEASSVELVSLLFHACMVQSAVHELAVKNELVGGACEVPPAEVKTTGAFTLWNSTFL